jgi:hypothetical protein
MRCSFFLLLDLVITIIVSSINLTQAMQNPLAASFWLLVSHVMPKNYDIDLFPSADVSMYISRFPSHYVTLQLGVTIIALVRKLKFGIVHV